MLRRHAAGGAGRLRRGHAARGRTSLGLDVRAGTVRAEGDLDFRGTLGVARDAPVGFREIRLSFDLDGDLTPEQRAKLIELTERYCAIYQTLRTPPPVTVSA